MNELVWLADQFEKNRDHLRAVAYRMLGSATEAEDAVQEAWLRLHRTNTSDIKNLAGWLTTVVGRVCLDMLRTRRSRHEDPADLYLLDSPTDEPDGADPEQHVMIADSVGLALLVVLETLDPAERIAFVLHDMFGLPFDEIAPIVDRTSTATRQLASRARRRVRGVKPVPDGDVGRQHRVVGAFLAAAREGDFDALVAVLDPDIVMRADGAGAPVIARGADAVASGALTFAPFAQSMQTVLVNGNVGILATPDGRPRLMTFVVEHEKIVEMRLITNPDRLRELELVIMDD